MNVIFSTHLPTATLGEVLSIADSGTWGDAGDEVHGMPVLRSSNIQNYKLDLTDVAWRIIPDKDKERRRLADLDIIVTKSSGSAQHIGKCCLFRDPGDGPSYYFSNFTQRLRAKQNLLDSRWLYYWLSSKPARAILEAMSSTTTGLRNLNVGRYLEQEIPLPPLPEQRRIAAILDKADAVRRKRQEAIRLTEEFLRSAFLEMFGDPVTNPKGWPIAQLHEICDEIVDCPHSTPRYASTQTPYPCLRSSDIQNGYLDWSTTKYVDAVEYKKRIERTTPITGDVIYCREGARFGNAARIQDSTNVCLGQRMMLFRVAPAAPLLATSEFLWGFMMCDSTYQQAVRLAGGSASPHVNVRDIKAFSTIVPPLELQESFSQLVKQSDLKRERYLESLRTLDGLFNALVQRAFRGEL